MAVREIHSWRKSDSTITAITSNNNNNNNNDNNTVNNNINDKDKKLRVVVFNDSDRKWATSGGGKR